MTSANHKMPSFGVRSEKHLATCDPRLQAVLREVVKHRDCTMLVGFRGQEEQDAAFEIGHSEKRWPMSRHNSTPSKAVDASPYPIDWKDRERFILFAGFVLGVAASLGVRLRWGGDWSMDGKMSDNKFDDLVHFELADT